MRKANRKARESLWFDIGWFTAEFAEVFAKKFSNSASSAVMRKN
jgi:hypothetical protein